MIFEEIEHSGPVAGLPFSLSIPFYMIITAFIVVFLQRGADELQTQTERIINADFADILIAIIIFFIIGCEFFINYQIKFRSRKQKEVEA